MRKYEVYDDMRTKKREAFVLCPDEELSSYSGWYLVAEFNTAKEADDFCYAYNNYIGEPDVEMQCCSKGCWLSAFDYAYSNGCCYEGT